MGDINKMLPDEKKAENSNKVTAKVTTVYLLFLEEIIKRNGQFNITEPGQPEAPRTMMGGEDGVGGWGGAGVKHRPEGGGLVECSPQKQPPDLAQLFSLQKLNY